MLPKKSPGWAAFFFGLCMIFLQTYISAVGSTGNPFAWSLGDARTQYFVIRGFQILVLGVFSVLKCWLWPFRDFQIVVLAEYLTNKIENMHYLRLSPT